MVDEEESGRQAPNEEESCRQAKKSAREDKIGSHINHTQTTEPKTCQQIKSQIYSSLPLAAEEPKLEQTKGARGKVRAKMMETNPRDGRKNGQRRMDSKR